MLGELLKFGIRAGYYFVTFKLAVGIDFLSCIVLYHLWVADLDMVPAAKFSILILFFLILFIPCFAIMMLWPLYFICYLVYVFGIGVSQSFDFKGIVNFITSIGTN